jgi:polyisoprenoid-binding protein YceI
LPSERSRSELFKQHYNQFQSSEANEMKTKMKAETKRKLSSLSAILVPVVLSWTVIAFPAINYAPGTYEIDTVHTRVSFTVPHFVISQVEGRFNDVKGSFTLGEPFSASNASVTVQIESIDTGVKQRDDDLRSKNFFEASQYPAMTFVAKSFQGTPESCKVAGALTIKDVTKDVTFDGKYTGVVTDPRGNQRVAVQLTGVINRRDFHINYDQRLDIGPAIGDEVTIRIFADGIMKKQAK